MVPSSAKVDSSPTNDKISPPAPKIQPSADSSASNWQDDFWGGLAAMLVALPSSIAFGILVYSSISPSESGRGAMAGLVGACALGLITPFVGRTKGLISAPCGPSAAVLSALVLGLMKSGGLNSPPPSVEFIVTTLTMVSLFSALIQILFGVVGGGNLIKFIPYQVVSGYLSGVGLLIGLSQLPKLLGLAKGVSLWQGLLNPTSWQWLGLIVGVATMAMMILAPKVTKKVPAPILALGTGLLTYFALSLLNRELLQIDHNSLIIGPLQVKGSFLDSLQQQFTVFASINWQTIKEAMVPALTLSVLLSIDTLKTCVALDSITRHRHNSNLEIIGQGLGNLACSVFGGIPGAGTMGATLVNISSGGKTPRAGVFEGILVLLSLLFLGPLLTWIPVASLAGILLVIAYRMFDRSVFRLLINPSGRFDFMVIFSVITVALTVDLIAASGTGIAMSIILFIRDQIRETVVLQKTSLNLISSKTRRMETEKAVLAEQGSAAIICRLQGNLFFGTTDQFSRTIESDLSFAKYLLLDMRRVHSLDYTAFHLLERIHSQLEEKGGQLLFSGMPSHLYAKRDFENYLAQMGLVNRSNSVLIFGTFDSALEWVEEEILKSNGIAHSSEERALNLAEFQLFRNFSIEELTYLQNCMSTHSIAKGELIVRHGDHGDEMFLVRRGSFRALLPLSGERFHHLATFEQGSFFGELAFLDHDSRSANIEAKTDAEVFIFSRSKFNTQSIAAPQLGAQVFARLASAIAQRLRVTDLELRVAEDR